MLARSAFYRASTRTVSETHRYCNWRSHPSATASALIGTADRQHPCGPTFALSQVSATIWVKPSRSTPSRRPTCPAASTRSYVTRKTSRVRTSSSSPPGVTGVAFREPLARYSLQPCNTGRDMGRVVFSRSAGRRRLPRSATQTKVSNYLSVNSPRQARGSINWDPLARLELTAGSTRCQLSTSSAPGCIRRAAPLPSSPSHRAQSEGSRISGIR